MVEENLVEFCDVFCEERVFAVEQLRRILNAAKDLGLKLKIHGDELVSTGGGELGVEVGAVTVEYSLQISDQSIKELGGKGVISVLLLGTPFYLMLDKYANARKILENNVALGVATDLNEGTSATESLQILMDLACYMMEMTLDGILTAVTRSGAYGINRGESRYGYLEDRQSRLFSLSLWYKFCR